MGFSFSNLQLQSQSPATFPEKSLNCTNGSPLADNLAAIDATSVLHSAARMVLHRPVWSSTEWRPIPSACSSLMNGVKQEEGNWVFLVVGGAVLW